MKKGSLIFIKTDVKELYDYISATYKGHYSKNQFQSTEFIIDCGHGEGFMLGNIIKYAQRYGKKNGYDRSDLLKVAHYAIMALHINSKQTNKEVIDDANK